MSNNIFYIKQLIEKKNSTTPFYLTREASENIKTDVDQFPYIRFNRGDPKSKRPIVFDREAGFCPVKPIPEKLEKPYRPMYDPTVHFTFDCQLHNHHHSKLDSKCKSCCGNDHQTVHGHPNQHGPSDHHQHIYH
jgi:hypothetical protein